MKLLFCGFAYGFGGAQKMQILLANAMADRGHQVTLQVLSSDDIKYPVSPKVDLRIEKEEKGGVSALFSRFRAVRRVIKELKPDLTVHFWLQTAYLCAFMGKKVASRTIYAERGDPYDDEYNGIRGLLRSISFPKLRAFVFQTEGAQGFFDEKIRARSTVIINPLSMDPAQYPQNAVADKRIVTSGRLHPQKNQKVFIDAISKLPAAFDDYIAEIYGDGEARAALQQRIDELGLQNRVFLRGASKEVLNQIKDAAVFVLTSDYEGIPNALIEAMGLGLPCVSTDCRPGGARTLIEDGVNGLIVPCADPQAVADGIAAYLSNPEFAQSCGDQARKIIDRTQPDTVFDRWEQFFQSMC